MLLILSVRSDPREQWSEEFWLSTRLHFNKISSLFSRYCLIAENVGLPAASGCL